MDQGLVINEQVSLLLNLDDRRITLYVSGQPVSVLTDEQMDNFTSAYASLRHRAAPLREPEVSSMVQHLAGDGLLTLRALGRTSSGYVLRLAMKRGGPRWTVRNYGEWYRAHEEAHLEAAKRGWL